MVEDEQILAIDLHVHVDEQVKYKKIPSILRARNLDGVGIVTHNDLNFTKKVANLLKRNDSEKIYIAGVEIDTLDGHLLAFGINEEIPPDLSAEETIELIREQNGVSIIPHPFMSHNSIGFKARNLKADAMEFYNGFAKIFFHFPNIMAKVYFKDKNFGRIGGSDAHSANAIGSCYSKIKINGEVSDENIIEAIRLHKTKPAIKPIDHNDIRNFINVLFTPKEGRKVIRF
jgi:predicted metal-dependent phosphoesterase TrpH